MVLGAVMTALVIILQALATFTTFFGPFSTALALIPIVIGAALCGPAISTWLGFVFGVVVLATGGAALFWGFSVHGTIITVLGKGAACGLTAGLIFKLLSKWNRTVAAIAAAIICPITNTAIFLLGGAVFFVEYADQIADILKMNVSGMALFWAMAMANFIFEIGMNIVLSPAIVRLINIRKKDNPQ